MTAPLRPRNTPTLPLPVVRPDPCIQTIPLRPEEIEEVREDDIATRQVDREELARRLGSPADLPRAPSPPPPALPPARPAATPPPIPASAKLRSRSRKLLVTLLFGGFAVVALATVVLAGETDPAPAPVAVEPQAPPQPVAAPDPVAELVGRAQTLVASSDREGALDLVLRSRVTYPQDARLAALAGRLYFEKLWWADGVSQLRAAFALEPSLRSDPELVALAVNGYITTPKANALLGRFVREDIGAAALPALDEIAKTHRSRTIRSRAAAEVRRMASH